MSRAGASSEEGARVTVESMKGRPAPEPQPAAPDLEGLADFAVSTDRDEPVKFVGRVKQIATLKRSLEVGLEHWRRGKPIAWKGASWLFQGAPGAGKTALLSHLGSLKIEDRTTGKHVEANICLLDRKADLYDGLRLEKKVAEAFIPGSARKMEGREAIREGGEASVDIGIAQAGASGHRTTDKPLRAWEDVVREIRESPKKHVPLLLLVDEAQALEDAARNQLMWLHEGTHGLPIVPVFGGLAWSKKRFEALGVSRLSDDRVHTLEALSEAECREAVRFFFGLYRIAGIAREGEKWERVIARESQGWPQHLHIGLKALAKELVVAHGDLERADEAAARKDAALRREQYYQSRLDSSELQSKRHLVAAAIARLGSGSELTVDDLADVIGGIHADAVSRTGSSIRLRLPEGYSGKRFAEAIIRAGVLHEDGDGYLSIPIPSFRAFLTERYPSGQ